MGLSYLHNLSHSEKSLLQITRGSVRSWTYDVTFATTGKNSSASFRWKTELRGKKMRRLEEIVKEKKLYW